MIIEQKYGTRGGGGGVYFLNLYAKYTHIHGNTSVQACIDGTIYIYFNSSYYKKFVVDLCMHINAFLYI